MLISEFAREVGLSVDTIRFYVRKGLLVPGIGQKGGANPYQIFTSAHVEAARIIRLAQSLGFSLKEIGRFNDEYRAGLLTAQRSADVILAQLELLEGKASQLGAMISYLRTKLAQLESGLQESQQAVPATID